MAITCVNPSIYHILPATSKTKISGSWKCNLSSNTYVNDPLSIRLSFPFAKVMRECGRLFLFYFKKATLYHNNARMPFVYGKNRILQRSQCGTNETGLNIVFVICDSLFGMHARSRVLMNFIWCNHSLYNTHCISYHFSVCLILFRDETDSR